MSDEQFRAAMAAALADDTGDRSRADRDRFLGALYYQQLDPAAAAARQAALELPGT